MSEQGVNPARRLFAIVDGWVRNLRIRDIDVGVAATVHSAALRMTAACGDVPLEVAARIAELTPLPALVVVRDALTDFARPRLVEARLTELQAVVAKAELGWTTRLDTVEVPCRLVVTVRDAGDALAAGAIRYEVRRHDLPFLDLQANVRALVTAWPVVVNDRPAAVQSLTIRRAPLLVSFLSQAEQLVFWKAAVRQTRRTARQLTLVGVYPAIPIGLAEGLRLDSRRAELLFQPRDAGGRGAPRLQDVAVFQDLVEDRAVIVVP